MIGFTSRRITLVVVLPFLISGLIYFFQKRTIHSFKYEFGFQGLGPKTVWEHLSKFEVQKQINPTIIDYEIIFERPIKGLDHEYQVKYHEYVVNLPILINENTGHYKVLANQPGYDQYVIQSQHVTCLYELCLNSTDSIALDMGLTPNSTKMVQNIEFECPTLLSWFCKREFLSQRALINKNLISLMWKK